MITTLGKPKYIHDCQESLLGKTINPVLQFSVSPCNKFLATLKPYDLNIYSNGQLRLLLTHISRHERNRELGPNKTVVWSENTESLIVTTYPGFNILIYSFYTTNNQQYRLRETNKDPTIHSPSITNVPYLKLNNFISDNSYTLELTNVISLVDSCRNLVQSDSYLIGALSKKPTFYFLDSNSYKILGTVHLNEFFEGKANGKASSSLNSHNEGHKCHNFHSLSHSTIQTASYLYAPYKAQNVLQYLRRKRRISKGSKALDTEKGEYISFFGTQSLEVLKSISTSSLSLNNYSRKSFNEFSDKKLTETHNYNAGIHSDYAGINIFKISKELDILCCTLTTGSALLLSYRRKLDYTENSSLENKKSSSDTSYSEINLKSRIIGISPLSAQTSKNVPIGIVLESSGVIALEININKQLIAIGTTSGKLKFIPVCPISTEGILNPVIVVDLKDLNPLESPLVLGALQYIGWNPCGSAIAVSCSKGMNLVISNTGKILFILPNPGEINTDISENLSEQSGVDVKPSNISSNGIYSMTWTSHGLGIMFCYHNSPHILLEFPIYYSSSLGLGFYRSCSTSSDLPSKVLIGSENIIINASQPWDSLNHKWISFKLPSTFLEDNWPIRQAILNPSTNFLLLVGNRNTALLDIQQNHWKFSDFDKLSMSFENLPIGWYSNSILFLCFKQHQKIINPENLNSYTNKIHNNFNQPIHQEKNYHLTFFQTNDKDISFHNSITFPFSLPSRPVLACVFSDELRFFKSDSILETNNRPLLGILSINLTFTSFVIDSSIQLNQNSNKKYSIYALWKTDFTSFGWIKFPLEIHFIGNSHNFLVLHASHELKAIKLTHKFDSQTSKCESEVWVSEESKVLMDKIDAFWLNEKSQLKAFIPLCSPQLDAFTYDEQKINKFIEQDLNLTSYQYPHPDSTNDQFNVLDQNSVQRYFEDILETQLSHLARIEEINKLRAIRIFYQLYKDHDTKFFKNVRGLLQNPIKSSEILKDYEDVLLFTGGRYVWCLSNDDLFLLSITYYENKNQKISCKLKNSHIEFRILKIMNLDNSRYQSNIINLNPNQSGGMRTCFTKRQSCKRYNTLHFQLLTNEFCFIHIILEHWLNSLIFYFPNLNSYSTNYIKYSIINILNEISHSHLPRVFDLLLHKTFEVALTDYTKALKRFSSPLEDEILNRGSPQDSSIRVFLIEAFTKGELFKFENFSTNSKRDLTTILTFLNGFKYYDIIDKSPESIVQKAIESLKTKLKNFDSINNSKNSTLNSSYNFLFKTDSLSTFNAMLYCCQNSGNFKLVYNILIFLRQFEAIFPSVLANLVRKSDPLSSPALIFPIAFIHPHTLFWKCFLEDKLEISSLYLIILQSLVGPELVREIYVLPLINKIFLTYNSQKLSLLNNLFRFYNAFCSPSEFLLIEEREKNDENLEEYNYSLLKMKQSSNDESLDYSKLIIDICSIHDQRFTVKIQSDNIIEQSLKNNPNYVFDYKTCVAKSNFNYSFIVGKIRDYLYNQLDTTNSHLINLANNNLWKPSIVTINPRKHKSNSINNTQTLFFRLEILIRSVLFTLLSSLNWLKFFQIASDLNLDCALWLLPYKKKLQTTFPIFQSSFQTSEHSTIISTPPTANKKPFTKSNIINLQESIPSYSFHELSIYISQTFPNTSTSASIKPHLGAPPKFFSGSSDLNSLHFSISQNNSILRYFIYLFIQLELPVPAFALVLNSKDENLLVMILEYFPFLSHFNIPH